MRNSTVVRRVLTAALIITTIYAGAAFAASKTLQIKGSDTMVNLMSNMAEAFMKVHSDISVAVTGGGSGTGIAALLNGTTDICASSRAFKKEEIDLAQSKNINPTNTVIGLDGLSVMVNKSNPINDLTIDQIKQIYTGTVTNWKDLGGPDMKIVVLSRESNSGTYVYFQEHVLNKADYAKSVLLMPSTAAIAKSVSEDKGAIGYGGIAYAEHAPVKTVKVKKAPDSEAIPPTMETVLNGTYPISRPLFLYTNGSPSGDNKTFIDYCMSDAGQKIVTETGYIPAPQK